MNKVFQRLISCILASVLSFAFICANPIISHAEDEFSEFTRTGYTTVSVAGGRNSLRRDISIIGSAVFKYRDTSVAYEGALLQLVYLDQDHKNELVEIRPIFYNTPVGDEGEVYCSFDFTYKGTRYVGNDIRLYWSNEYGKCIAFLNAADYIVPAEEEEVARCLMYRLHNPNSGEHFYTGSLEELENLKNEGWIHEGNGFEVPVLSDTPVYRLYNPNAGDHHYTASAEEKDNLVNAGWKFEGIAWYSAPIDCNPLYRLNNPNASSGAHHYTMSEEERDNLINAGWNLEGIGWFGY